MTYNEAQRLASQKYREKKREHINEQERLRYAKMKIEKPEKYQSLLEQKSENCRQRSKEKTLQNKHIRGLMRIVF